MKVNKCIKKETKEGDVGPGSYEVNDSYDLRRNKVFSFFNSFFNIYNGIIKGYSWGKKPISHQNLRKVQEAANLGPGEYILRNKII